jgi:nucleoid-associated protein YgaU
MQKDMKIGMLLGLVLVTVAMVWLSTGPSLSPKAAGPNPRPVPSSMGGARSNQPSQEDPTTPNNFSTNDLTAQSTEDNQSEPPDSTIYEQTEKIKTQKFHIVREGETLSEISRKYYDSANKWQMILDANRQTIKDANKIRPGTKLIIPE